MSTPATVTTKVIIITGASSGIGRALALAIAKRNAATLKEATTINTTATTSTSAAAAGTAAPLLLFRVVLAARTMGALDAVVAECNAIVSAIIDSGASASASSSLLASPFVVPFQCDVTVREEVKALMVFAKRAFGRIDTLVNNAGRGCSVVPSLLTDALVDDMVSINVKSALYGMQEVLPYFTNASGEGGSEGEGGEGGHIINVSSVLGRCPMPNPFALDRSAYSASKHMLTAITDLFRVEMQQSANPTYNKVKVSVFSPGVVGTDFGFNAGGGDSRAIPGAQDVDEVAAILVEEVVVKQREDVYSRDMYKGVVEGYLKERHSA